jgi:hypothetical protein
MIVSAVPHCAAPLTIIILKTILRRTGMYTTALWRYTPVAGCKISSFDTSFNNNFKVFDAVVQAFLR